MAGDLMDAVLMTTEGGRHYVVDAPPRAQFSWPITAPGIEVVTRSDGDYAVCGSPGHRVVYKLIRVIGARTAVGHRVV